jgi:predicted dehydrogenase
VTAQRHLPALRRLGSARVVALADVDGARLDALAREYGIARRYATHEELIADPSVDAVAVCVPASLHADVAVEALDAGKHALVEKPLTLTLEDAERVRAAAARNHGTVTIGLNLRWHRLVRRARELVLGGELGDIQAIRTVFTSSFDYRATARPWRFRREAGGGAIGEIAPHHLDLWRFLTASEVEEVFAWSHSGRDEDETAVVTGVLGAGVRAETLVSQRSTNVNEVEIFGERGRLRVSCYRHDGLELQLGYRFGGDLGQRLRGAVSAAAALPAFARSLRHGGVYVESYAAQWRHFVDAVSVGAAADPGLEDGIRNVEVLLAALESLASGQPVPVAAARAQPKA